MMIQMPETPVFLFALLLPILVQASEEPVRHTVWRKSKHVRARYGRSWRITEFWS